MKHNRIFRQGAMIAAGAALTAVLTLSASAATAYSLGDIDLDGSVAAADLTALSCAVGRMSTLDTEGYTLGADGTVYEIGDITLDGDVTAADLTALARHMGGIETLPTDAVTYAGVYSADGTIIIHQSTDGYESDTTVPAAAFDGDLSTGWQSATEQDGDYIGLTFAAPKTMDSVTIDWAENERANTTNTGYTVQYTTDGTTWQAVPEADYDFGTPTEGITTDVVSFTVIRATGFRVVIHRGTSEKYAPKIHELTFHEVADQTGTVLWQSEGGTDDDKTGTAAFDGDLSTGWQSASQVSGDYLGFTFPACTVKTVMIDWEAGTRAAASASGYTVEYTVNGTDWTAVSSAQYIFGQDVDGIATDTVRFAPVTATGIRVVVQEFTSDKYAAKIYELNMATETPLTGTVLSSSAGGTDADKTAAAAVDSSLTTGWQSLTSVSGDYIGMTFDRQLVRSAIINWETVTRPTATAGGYVLQYTTDGSSWKDCTGATYTFGKGLGGVSCDVVNFDPVPAVGLRVVVKAFSNGMYAPKVYELAFFGKNLDTAEDADWVSPYTDAALTLMLNTIEDYYDAGNHDLHGEPGGSGNCFVWAFGSFLEALSDTYELYPDNETVRATYVDALTNGIAKYRVTGSLTTPAGTFSDIVYYNASAGNHSDYYYDDNAWICLQFLRAYELLGDSQYLTRAEELLRFFETGWDDVLGGGFYWSASFSCKNTCADGPIAIAFLEAYQLTGNGHYLDMARKTVDWMNDVLRDGDGLYIDNVDTSGNRNTWKADYNQGTPLYALSLLASITGESEYRALADVTAKAAMNNGFSYDTSTAVGTIYGNPIYKAWCVGWLMRGFEEYAKIASGADFNAFAAMDYVLTNVTLPGKDANGYYDPYFGTTDWTGETTDVLQPSGVVSTMLACARYNRFIR